MLIEFRFKNYRSFRDEAVLSMEAVGLSSLKNCLIEYGNMRLLPGAAIYGKNGGGKSNVIRAFWLGVQFIRNAQRMQHEKATVPVAPFALNDYSMKEPTEFEFDYIVDDVKYWYSFAATREKIVKEALYHAPKGQKAQVFVREEQKFSFTEDKAKRKLISATVAENQLFFSIACTMNDAACVNAMKWFREDIFFSRDYTDIPRQLLEYYDDSNMLKAISDYAKAADFGIEEMQFKIENKEIRNGFELPESIPEGMKEALSSFLKVLSETSESNETKLKMSQVRAKAVHKGIASDGEQKLYHMDLEDESDGTRKLMSVAPAIESVLKRGGVLLIDELEKELHPMLVNFIIAKFQSKRMNTNGAQIIFTTHNTELMNMELIRKDQIYFADKRKNDGASELYSVTDFSTKTADNIRKGYLVGKYGATPNIEIEEVG
nr:ATP-binding protein [uncultured Mediterraneibacter sp.]